MTVDNHVTKGVTCTAETSLAREAIIWLEADITPAPNPTLVQQTKATVDIGPGASTNEWDDPAHKAFWLLLKEAGYEEK